MKAFIDLALALLLGLVLPALAARSAHAARGGEPQAFTTHEKIRIYWLNSANLWFLALVTAGAWVLRDRTAEHLGFTPPQRNWAATLVALAIVVGVALDTWWQVGDPARREATRARWRRDAPFMPAAGREFAHYAVMAVSAGVCEEVMYRGFLIRYLQGVLGEGACASTFAVVLPAAVFGVAHGYQGGWRATKIAVLAVLFGLVFVWTSSLLVPVVLHTGIDLAMGAVGVRMLRVKS